GPNMPPVFVPHCSTLLRVRGLPTLREPRLWQRLPNLRGPHGGIMSEAPIKYASEGQRVHGHAADGRTLAATVTQAAGYIVMLRQGCRPLLRWHDLRAGYLFAGATCAAAPSERDEK